MRAARSLPMPGISRSPVSLRSESSCGWLAAMSAPLRYARILNGLSFLISRRSAISRRMRAIARLSKPQAFGLDMVVEQACPARRELVGDRRPSGRRAVTEEASAAAGAAHLGCRRTCGLRPRDQVVDGRCRDAGRQPLAVVPLDGNLATDLVPVAALERGPHRERRVADPLEAIEKVTVAAGVALGDVPVVRSGIARRAGVRQHDPALELLRVHAERDAPDAGDAELDGRDAAIQGGTIVLHAGRDADRLALHVHRDLE